MAAGSLGPEPPDHGRALAGQPSSETGSWLLLRRFARGSQPEVEAGGLLCQAGAVNWPRDLHVVLPSAQSTWAALGLDRKCDRGTPLLTPCL